MEKAYKKKGVWGKPPPENKQNSKPKYDSALENKVIKKYNELYISGRNKYLIMDSTGNYTTQTYGKNAKCKLNDNLIRDHLRGKKTVGVHAGDFLTKFICFDVDVVDPQKAKWVVYKLVHTLIQLGVPQEYIHISFSGTKGYHVEMFFSSMVSNDLVLKFYKIVLNKAELMEFDFGEVELRPTNQGVKLPLGINFKNKDKKTNRCWFVDYTKGLKHIKKFDYILSVQPMEKDILLHILEKFEALVEDPVEPKPKKKNKTKKNTSKDNPNPTSEEIQANHSPLQSYQENIDEDITVSAAEELIRVGLRKVETRHKSLIKICKYFKSMLRYEPEQCKQELIRWMELQDKQFYTTSWEDCLEDINEIVEWVYGKNIGLTASTKRNIEVSKAEMDSIMKLPDKYDKIILYALLVHSKRYARESGVFYMTFEQMVEATGISDKTVRNHVNELEKQKVIEIVARDQKIFNKNGTYIDSKPNEYKITLTVAEEEIESPKFTVLDGGKDCKDTYLRNVCTFYTNKQLKDMVSERQLKELRKYRKLMVA